MYLEHWCLCDDQGNPTEYLKTRLEIGDESPRGLVHGWKSQHRQAGAGAQASLPPANNWAAAANPDTTVRPTQAPGLEPPPSSAETAGPADSVTTAESAQDQEFPLPTTAPALPNAGSSGSAKASPPVFVGAATGGEPPSKVPPCEPPSADGKQMPSYGSARAEAKDHTPAASNQPSLQAIPEGGTDDKADNLSCSTES